MTTTRTNRYDSVATALIFGSLWGAVESTLGYLLHRAHVPGLAGTILLPAGIFFMVAAAKGSGRASAAMMTAMVAAAWKCLNLFLPGGVMNIVNPARAILAEGLLTAVVFQMLDWMPRIPVFLTAQNRRPGDRL